MAFARKRLVDIMTSAATRKPAEELLYPARLASLVSQCLNEVRRRRVPSETSCFESPWPDCESVARSPLLPSSGGTLRCITPPSRKRCLLIRHDNSQAHVCNTFKVMLCVASEAFDMRA